MIKHIRGFTLSVSLTYFYAFGVALDTPAVAYCLSVLFYCFWYSDAIGLWNPFRKDSSLDYENDSDEEWEEVLITKSLW